MSGRSPSGVASLRARFEQNADSESLPPSRGRSPAGSITGDSSRPLSKVRTSFISVGEPSGQMSDFLGGKEMGKPIPVDGAEESKGKEPSKINGGGPTSAPKEMAEYSTKTKEVQEAPEPSMTLPEKPDERTTPSALAAANPDKPATGAEDHAASTLPSDSKSEAMVSEEDASAKDTTDLGSILKGSAFETDEPKKGPAPQKPAASDAPKTIEKILAGPKTSAVPATSRLIKGPTAMEKAANGKLKEPQASETKPQPKAASEQPAVTKTQSAPKPAPAASAKPAGKEPEKEILATPAPAANNTSSNKDKVTKPISAPLAPTGSTEVAAAAAAAAVSNEPSSKKTEAESSKEPTKEPINTPKPSSTLPDRKGTGPPDPSKPSKPSTASTTTKAPPRKILHPNSPPTSGTGFTKPKPRSPTRPVKLPSHLTAQTAASAAKHGDESHVEPHKDTSAASSKPPNPRIATHAPPQQRRPPRASMPAAGSSKPAEKEKPKPRMSVAGGTAPGGSFLERMMRPTQSSAQKTHERVEPGKNSPPRKPSGSRNVSGAGLKTVTGASTHKPDQHAHNDGGHGDRREKHGGPTKSEVEHGEGQEAAGTGMGKEAAATPAASASSAPKAKPAPPPEEAKMPSARGITEEKAKDQAAPASGPDPGRQTF